MKTNVKKKMNANLLGYCRKLKKVRSRCLQPLLHITGTPHNHRSQHHRASIMRVSRRTTNKTIINELGSTVFEMASPSFSAVALLWAAHVNQLVTSKIKDKCIYQCFRLSSDQIIASSGKRKRTGNELRLFNQSAGVNQGRITGVSGTAVRKLPTALLAATTNKKFGFLNSF